MSGAAATPSAIEDPLTAVLREAMLETEGQIVYPHAHAANTERNQRVRELLWKAVQMRKQELDARAQADPDAHLGAVERE